MASTSPIKFIDTALLATGPFALSYADPDQKLLIRDHLISLLQDFPKFKLSTDTFTYNNGVTVNLLRLDGQLRVPKLPPVPVILWVHEDYPIAPPMVFVNPTIPIHRNHPFVDSSGSTKPSYIRMWEHPRCNLLELTRRLVKIFRDDHPFAGHISDSTTHTSLLPSKMDALDNLARDIHHDVSTLQRNAEGEIENLWRLQAELRTRSHSVSLIIAELESERRGLRELARKVQEEGDALRNWLEANNPSPFEAALGSLGVEHMFRGVDDETERLMESLAADAAIEDVIRRMETAVDEGAVAVGEYMKQVRSLAREQYFHRFNHLELSGRLSWKYL